MHHPVGLDGGDPARPIGRRWHRATLAIATVGLYSRLLNPVATVGPSHEGIGWIWVADGWVGGAVESVEVSMARDYLCETSFAHVTNIAIEARLAG